MQYQFNISKLQDVEFYRSIALNWLYSIPVCYSSSAQSRKLRNLISCPPLKLNSVPFAALVVIIPQISNKGNAEVDSVRKFHHLWNIHRRINIIHYTEESPCYLSFSKLISSMFPWSCWLVLVPSSLYTAKKRCVEVLSLPSLVWFKKLKDLVPLVLQDA